jgi:DNA-binding MarR family transcriptional regulator
LFLEKGREVVAEVKEELEDIYAEVTAEMKEESEAVKPETTAKADRTNPDETL